MKFHQLLLIGVVLAGGECCSIGFEEINGQCYALHTEVVMPWQDALLYCESSSSVPTTLAKIETGKTLRAVYQYITQYSLSGSFWLGGSDLDFEDDWVWLDKTRVTRGTPFWSIHSQIIGGWTHDPSGGTDENCLALDDQRLFYFNDAPCESLFHPLCQETM